MASRALHQPDQLDTLLAAIPGLPRRVLNRLVARMIDHMDAMDPDPDLEEDDPAGDPLDDGEDEDWRPKGIVLDRPQYGDDQSLGPINEGETHRNFNAAAWA